MDQDLVLLFGLPRSGTTWIGKIFDSSPVTLYRHEPDSHQRLSLPLFAPAEDPAAAAALARYATDIGAMTDGSVAGKLPLFPKQYLVPGQLGLYRGNVYAAKAAGRLGVALPLWFAPGARAARKAVVVWKSIESVGRSGLALRALPRARLVLILRHPCAYAASVMRGDSQQRFRDRTPASEDYGLFEQLVATPTARRYGLDLDRLRVLSPWERLAWRWVVYNEKAWDEIAEEPRARLLRYEALCADPFGVTRDLFNFAGIDYGPQTEAFLRLSTGGRDGGYYSVYRDPGVAAWRWREEMAAADQAAVMAIARNSRVGAVYFDGSEETG